ncbi:MAG: hypothetical protein CMD28_01290 [Flavobacteriales bacterium]|nr:hypothetical protein [Flavobacteriales bacterium]|tara:strand:+ start:14965 stop:15828 length:864 start_codon:yes stop_codon:yes gene_type:complete
MAKPTTKQELKDFCLRRLGAPVLEINVSDEQIDDAYDDALQLFQERCYNGVERMYLKHQITQEDIDRGQATNEDGSTNTVGIVTTTATSTSISGLADPITSKWYETSNFIQIPDSVVGIEKIFKFDASTISGGMFSIKYQLFLNDVAFNLGYNGLLSYAMTKSYLQDIDMMLTTDKQIRFNQRQDRLYLDIDWGSSVKDNYIIVDCYRALDPTEFTGVFNDPFIKNYLTALIKRQWGQNLIKFQGVKLPGGIELNGRQLYDDAERDLESIISKMSSEYEVPPLDLIG